MNERLKEQCACGLRVTCCCWHRECGFIIKRPKLCGLPVYDGPAWIGKPMSPEEAEKVAR